MNFLIIFFAKYIYLFLVAIVLVFIILSTANIRKQLAKVSLFSLPLSFLLLKILASLYYNPRPFVVNHIQPLITHAADNGFPSDHTTLCATFASIIFIFNKKIGIFLYCLTLLVGVSRVLALVHHPIDILGGLATGIFSVYISRFLLKKYRLI
jgi:undecaprenyl-diphosphatase